MRLESKLVDKQALLLLATSIKKDSALRRELWRVRSELRKPFEEEHRDYWVGALRYTLTEVVRDLRKTLQPKTNITSPSQLNHLVFIALERIKKDLLAPTKALHQDTILSLAEMEIKIHEEISRILAGGKLRGEKGKPPKPAVEVDWENFRKPEFANRVSMFTDQVKYATDDAKRKVESVISSAIGEGIPAEALIDEIAKATDGEWSGFRAERLARTEMNTYSNRVSLAAMRNDPVVGTKTWLSMGDDKVRDAHDEVDGTEILVDEKFNVGGDEMDCPGDPSASPENIINCRCDMIEGVSKDYLPEGVSADDIYNDIIDYLDSEGE